MGACSPLQTIRPPRLRHRTCARLRTHPFPHLMKESAFFESPELELAQVVRRDTLVSPVRAKATKTPKPNFHQQFCEPCGHMAMSKQLLLED